MIESKRLKLNPSSLFLKLGLEKLHSFHLYSKQVMAVFLSLSLFLASIFIDVIIIVDIILMSRCCVFFAADSQKWLHHYSSFFCC